MDFANEIRNSLDTQEVFSNYGLRPNRSGFVCCFLHNERTPSMKVYKGNGGYYCFGCGARGSVIDFVMQYFGLTFTDAISKINADFSLGLPIGERISLRQRREMEHRQRNGKRNATGNRGNGNGWRVNIGRLLMFGRNTTQTSENTHQNHQARVSILFSWRR